MALFLFGGDYMLDRRDTYSAIPILDRRIKALEDKTDSLTDISDEVANLNKMVESISIPSHDNNLNLPVGSVVVLGNTCYTEGTGTSTTISTGSSYATLKDPSKFGYAGTWRLMYKIMTARVINTGLMTMNTTNVSAISTQHCYVSGKTITIHGSFTNKTAHSDTTRALLTISTSAIGVASICGSAFIINGVDDGNNGIPVLQLQNNGTLSEIDYISRATSVPTATGGVTSFSFTTAVTDNYIYDSACCEFHWQRTA